MKKIFFFFICCGYASYLYGQNMLESEMHKRSVSVHIPSFLTVSENNKSIILVEGKEFIPTLPQVYDFAPSFGNTAINAYFGLVNAILRPDSGDYIVFVIVYGGKRGSLVPREPRGAYDRIKHDLRYGSRLNGCFREEMPEVDLMLTHYPREKARELFNADWMFMYPMNFRGEVYENIYSRCRAIALYKDGVAIHLYFLMTDQSYRNFDSYLNDFKGVFWMSD